MTEPCPRCGAERTRRGGTQIWIVYLALLGAAVPAVLIVHLPAGLVAAIMLVIVVIAHLTLGQRVCLECGHQWRT